MVSNVLLGASALLGVGTVPITSALKGEHWPIQLKFGLALVLTAIVATIQTIVTGDVHNFAQFLALWAVAVASGQTFYQTYFGGTTFEKQLKSIGHIAGTVRNVTDQVAPAINIAVKGNQAAETIATDIQQAIDKVAPK